MALLAGESVNWRGLSVDYLWVGQEVVHCQRFAKLYAEEAKEAKALAKMQEQMAKTAAEWPLRAALALQREDNGSDRRIRNLAQGLIEG